MPDLSPDFPEFDGVPSPVLASIAERRLETTPYSPFAQALMIWCAIAIGPGTRTPSPPGSAVRE